MLQIMQIVGIVHDALRIQFVVTDTHFQLIDILFHSLLKI